MVMTSLDSEIDIIQNNGQSRMSFLFPTVFKDMLTGLKMKYKKDMTYIVMEAVNEWVMKKESITPKEVNNV